jgi:hypothetical protein
MGAQVEDWMSEIEHQFDHYGPGKFPEERVKISFAVSFLTGDALHWWNGSVDKGAVVSWVALKQLLVSRYRPVQAAQVARQRLQKLRMHAGHNVNAYIHAFQNVTAPITDMSVTDQVFNFIRGLLPTIGQKVFERNPTTLQEAFHLAVSVEGLGNLLYVPHYHHAPASSGGSAPMDINSIESFLQGDVSPVVPTPSIDPMVAKVRELELQLNALRSNSAPKPRKFEKIPGLTPDAIKKLQSEGKCFKCKQSGHMKNECPNSLKQ